MKKFILLSMVLTLMTRAISAPTMTMTTSKSRKVLMLLAGSGSCTIDWGDGSAIATLTLQAPTQQGWAGTKHIFTHRYSKATRRVISITSENITHLSC